MAVYWMSVPPKTVCQRRATCRISSRGKSEPMANMVTAKRYFSQSPLSTKGLLQGGKKSVQRIGRQAKQREPEEQETF